MSGTIVCLHGAFAGGWCFGHFARVFTAAGWSCHRPDLQGHGTWLTDPSNLTGVGLADYQAELAAFVRSLNEPPVLLGHSMGAVLDQQLAPQGLARALVLVSPAPRAGILPTTESERQAAQGLMCLGPFWTTVVHPSFDVAATDSLNCVPDEERRPIFEWFGPESGRVLFELFYWMLDGERASHVDCEAVRCPVLCLSGEEDRVVSIATAQATAAAFHDAEFRAVPGAGHMLLVEPGADDIASDILRWIERL